MILAFQHILAKMFEQEKRQAEADIKNAEPFYQHLAATNNQKAVQNNITPTQLEIKFES